jgi:hypothetical protein
MPRADWDRIQELFDAALKLDAPARDVFLAAACRGDDALLEEVRSLLAAHDRADGAPRTLPNLILTRGARRMAFLGGEDALVIMKGDISHKEFWVVDLKTGRERQLTNLGREFAIGDFDISADGREIIFDRAREESDIVLLDLPDR